MLPSLLALGAVAAVVLLLIGVFGRSPGTAMTGGTPLTGTSAPNSSVTVATSASPSTPPPRATTAPQLTTASPTTSAPAPTTTAPSTTGPSTTGPSTSAPVDLPDIDVVVLNSTGETGLASRVGDYLAGLGWAIGEPGNFTEALELTTVYFPAGHEDAARTLAAASPGSGTTVAPATPEMGAELLTLVLGQDALGWTPPT